MSIFQVNICILMCLLELFYHLKRHFSNFLFWRKIGMWVHNYNINKCFNNRACGDFWIFWCKIQPHSVKKIEIRISAYGKRALNPLLLTLYSSWLVALTDGSQRIEVKKNIEKKNCTINLMSNFKYDTKKDLVRKMRWVEHSACGYKLVYAHVAWYLVILNLVLLEVASAFRICTVGLHLLLFWK